MSARLSPAEAPFSAPIQAWLDRTMPPGRAPLQLFTTLARDERLFGKFFAGALLDRGHLGLRQREIVIHRTTALCRCEYEWGVHVRFFARAAELGPAQLAALAARDAAADAAAGWSEPERRLIRLCDELHAGATVSDTLWAGLREDHADAALLELLMLAGYYRTVSYLANGLRLPLEPDAARWPA